MTFRRFCGRRSIRPGLLVLGLVLVACGDHGSSGSGSGDDRGTSSGPEIPQDGDTVIVQFTTGGGLAGPCCAPGTIPELTADARAVRQAVLDLSDRLAALGPGADDAVGYTPAELALYVFAADPEPGVEPTPWPLDRSLADGGTPVPGDGRCLHLTTDSSTVLAAARDSASPIWTSAGRTWQVTVRPLLPHEHDCP